MKKTLFIFTIILFFVFGNYLFLENNAVAAFINFETVPNPPGPPIIPNDGDPITNQYSALIDGGVTFSTDAASLAFPLIEDVGQDGTDGFYHGTLGQWDTEATPLPPGTLGLGDKFLRLNADNLLDGTPPTLIIDYLNPVSAASAQIWDIDSPTPGPGNYERWEVTAFEKTGPNTYNPLQSVESPIGLGIGDPNTLDALPWTWFIDRGLNNFEIDRIEIAWTGTKTMGIGLAFDNFNTTAVPIPGAIWLFGSGILGMVFMRRKLKN